MSGQTTKRAAVKCHLCGAVHKEIDVHLLPCGVTSDCQPWSEEVRIFVCPNCHAVQAPVDEAWRTQVDRIYRAYDTYAAAGGQEQKVMAGDGAATEARSRVLLGWLASLGLLASRGNLLDVGCGRGAFLQEFGREFPEWDLHGTEFDDRNLEMLRRLPGFRELQSGNFENLHGEFDLISMLHVLEHIENPGACLTALRQRAAKGALLLVQVPDWSGNPFALAIADHATHFTPAVLAGVAREAGWELVAPVANVVPKELTLLARASSPGVRGEGRGKDAAGLLGSRLSWLRDVRDRACSLRANSENFGIFGTAVAATWLAGSLRGRVDFFVDEDANRVGGVHLGVPIVSPAMVPTSSDVFVGLAPVVSARLVDKLNGGHSRYHGVPSLAGS
jgi:2-polyprenyl-3-methyl-5-hydroxy-6-metoxy-1,4-benzoquinol methylase